MTILEPPCLILTPDIVLESLFSAALGIPDLLGMLNNCLVCNSLALYDSVPPQRGPCRLGRCRHSNSGTGCGPRVCS